MTLETALQRMNLSGPVAAQPSAAGASASVLSASTVAANAKTAKLVDAAEQFEAMMLNELLKPLNFGAGVEEAGDENAGGAADTIRGMGTDALSKALASHGGMGIARKIVKDVTRERDSVETRRRGAKVQ